MGKKLVYNTALLTGSSLLMRCIGMAFQAWLAGRIGATGIGLFQLVMSVEMLCTTLAVSGIRFAATRIVAEEIGSGREGAVGTAVFRCCMYSLLFGCAAAALRFWIFSLTLEMFSFVVFIPLRPCLSNWRIASWATLSTPEERRSDAYSPGELSSAYRLWSALSLVRI